MRQPDTRNVAGQGCIDLTTSFLFHDRDFFFDVSVGGPLETKEIGSEEVLNDALDYVIQFRA